MVYKKFQDMEISALGLGTMRLPVIDGDAGRIDEEAARKIVAYAMEHGVNYYDTAWGYHEEQSEIVTGKLLSEYPRESFYLATKFPGYDPTNISAEKGREIFERQLEKCRVDYFDFYLFHNVNGANINPYLADAQNGLASYLFEQKKNGRIRHLGFSVHGDYDITKRFIDAYKEQIEFCQIQLNWIDFDFQEAWRKVDLLFNSWIPIWVMEPLRGGKLATLPEKYAEQLRALRPDETIPGWGFRFIQSITPVVVTLSGMSSLDQVKQNIEIFQTEEPLNKQEWDTIIKLAGEMSKDLTVPCTDCRYCTSFCPQKIDIPRMLSLYNDQVLGGTALAIPEWMLGPTPKEQQPGGCIACKSCETVCPQGIKISELMAKCAAAIVP